MEVTATLEFTFPCLGTVRERRGKGAWFRFLRNAQRQIIFLPEQWESLLRYAAMTTNSCQGMVDRVAWDLVIHGVPSTQSYRRKTAAGPQAFVFHEQFEPGSTIQVHAKLPEEMELPAFHRLLTFIGKERGFSPYHDKREKYGTFEIIALGRRVFSEEQRIKNGVLRPASQDPCGFQSAGTNGTTSQ